MIECQIVEKWIADTLLADSQIAALIKTAVFINLAPQGFNGAFLLVIYHEGADVNTFGGRALAQPLYEVVAISRHVDIGLLRTLAIRADQLLQDARVVTAGYYLRIQREGPIHEPELGTGVEYVHVGGLYRCWISPAA